MRLRILVLAWVALAHCASAQNCSINTVKEPSWWPNNNRPSYCCPYAGDGTDAPSTRVCLKIDPGTGAGYIKNISSPNPCYWSNLAGQTPDKTQQWNAPFKNLFTTVGFYTKPSSQNTNHRLPTSGYSPAYYAQVTPPASGKQAGWQECMDAKSHYTKFNDALNRYNCEEQYSHWNCDDCRNAYARWVSAIMLPACALQPGDTAGGGTCTAIKPCVRVCNDVVKKCPVTLGFKCPADDRDYAETGAPYCQTLSASETTYTPQSYTDPTSSPTSVWYTAIGQLQASSTSIPVDPGFTTDCCNSMALQNGAAAVSWSGLAVLMCFAMFWLTL